MNGVIKLYEQKLKQLNPNLKTITYDISDLFNFIDAIGDISALVFSPETSQYVPYSKEWIKKRVYTHLKSMAK
jgi:hypothetical protein